MGQYLPSSQLHLLIPATVCGTIANVQEIPVEGREAGRPLLSQLGMVVIMEGLTDFETSPSFFAGDLHNQLIDAT